MYEERAVADENLYRAQSYLDHAGQQLAGCRDCPAPWEIESRYTMAVSALEAQYARSSSPTGRPSS